MTKAEIAAKVEWEGGATETIMGYGLKSSELPDDAPFKVQAAWRMLEMYGRKAVEVIENWLEAE